MAAHSSPIGAPGRRILRDIDAAGGGSRPAGFQGSLDRVERGNTPIRRVSFREKEQVLRDERN